VLAEAGGVPDASRKGKASAATRELAARLKLWKLADHGNSAALAHSPRPLSASDLKQLERLTHDADAYVHAPSPLQAVMTLQAVGPRASPLLPYLVRVLPGEPVRAIALMRLRHAPYDTLAWLVQRRETGWTLVSVQATVDP